MKYFPQETVAEIKAHYRRLCMKHHPDRGGDTATMQAINAEYHIALERCDGQTSTGTDDKPHTYHYDHDQEQAVMDKIAEIVALGMVDVQIFLIGTWIWITGNTKPYKDLLGKNGLKLIWHAKRGAWYWHDPAGGKSRYNRKVDLNGLARAYGYTEFESEERKRVNSTA